MIGIAIDDRAALRAVASVFKQVNFAAANALNDLVFEARDTERNTVEGRFTIRRPWVLQGIQVPTGGKATRDKLEADLVLDEQRDFLTKFEKGGVKRPVGPHSLAVPDDQAFRHTQVIPQGKRPKAFEFRLHRTKLNNAVQFKGDQRTFIIEKGIFERGIFQRVGRGPRSEARLLFWLTRAAQVEPDLRFERTANDVAQRSYHRHFQRRFIEALRTAR